MCEDKQRKKELPVGISVIELMKGCKIQSKWFSTPIYQGGETKIEEELQLETEIRLDALSPNIWEHSKFLSETFDEIYRSINDSLKPLDKIKNLPLNLINLLSGSSPIKEPLSQNIDKDPSWFKITMIVLIGVVLLFGLIIIALKLYLKLHTKCKRRIRYNITQRITSTNEPSGVITHDFEEPEQLEMLEVIQPTRFDRPT